MRGKGRARGYSYARSKKLIHPAWLCQNGCINRFDESAGTAGEEGTVGVEVRVHVGIHLPAWREAQGELSRKDYKHESKEQDDEYDNPILPPSFNGFHAWVPPQAGARRRLCRDWSLRCVPGFPARCAHDGH